MFAIIKRMFGGKAPKRPRVIGTISRAYELGIADRLNADWKVDGGYSARAMATQWPRMVGRSRERAKNDCYVKRAIELYVTNVVGYEGFKFHAMASDSGKGGTRVPDTSANAAIDAAFTDWMREPAYCDASGRKTFVDICSLAVRNLVRDGEFIIRILPGFDYPDNPHSFALKVYDPTSLDVCLNGKAKSGNRVHNGVELNQWGKPLNYYFRTGASASSILTDLTNTVAAKEHIVIPASEIIHCFVPEWEDQIRGVPWLYSTLPMLRMLSKYMEAELVAARENASTVGHYDVKEGEEYDPADSYEKLTTQTRDVEAGAVYVNPPGVSFRRDSPTRPNEAMPEFVKAMLRAGASGSGVPYPDLSNDLEHVSYSSIRQGVLTARDGYRMVQGMLRSYLCRRAYLSWLPFFLVRPDVFLPVTKIDKFKAHKWQARSWQWVDPRNDAQTAVLMRKYGWKSDITIADDVGQNFRENVETIKAAEPLVEGTYLADNYKEKTYEATQEKE